MSRPATSYQRPFRSSDFSNKNDVSEIEGLRRMLREKDVELSRANAMIREQADMLDFLKIKLEKIQAATGISTHDSHLGTTKE